MPVRENAPERAGLRSAHPVSRPHLRSESREARDSSRAASLCTAETDSPLEEGGFEPSVPRTRRSPPCPHDLLQPMNSEVPLMPPERCRRFLRKNSGRIGGVEKGEFERDSARKEVAAQICVRRADTVQLRAQEIDEPTKIRIVVQRDPLRVYEVVRRRLRRAGGPI